MSSSSLSCHRHHLAQASSRALTALDRLAGEGALNLSERSSGVESLKVGQTPHSKSDRHSSRRPWGFSTPRDGQLACAAVVCTELKSKVGVEYRGCVRLCKAHITKLTDRRWKEAALSMLIIFPLCLEPGPAHGNVVLRLLRLV